jgi:hypothetical protein
MKSSSRTMPTTEHAVGQLELRERLLEERVALLHAVLDHLDAVAGERRGVEGARDPHDLDDLMGQRALRPQHAVDRQPDRLHRAALRNAST